MCLPCARNLHVSFSSSTMSNRRRIAFGDMSSDQPRLRHFMRFASASSSDRAVRGLWTRSVVTLHLFQTFDNSQVLQTPRCFLHRDQPGLGNDRHHRGIKFDLLPIVIAEANLKAPVQHSLRSDTADKTRLVRRNDFPTTTGLIRRATALLAEVRQACTSRADPQLPTRIFECVPEWLALTSIKVFQASLNVVNGLSEFSALFPLVDEFFNRGNRLGLIDAIYGELVKTIDFVFCD